MQQPSAYTQHYRRLKFLLVALIVLAFATPPATAQNVGQITIGGKVFGGGLQGQIGTENANNTLNASIVTIKKGDLSDVYGGGEMGNSKGQTNVILQGGTVSGSVFGGARMADIDGQTHVLIDGENATNDLIVTNVFGGNDISGNVNGTALVESTYGDESKKIYVTNLFGGGNGDYDYASNKVDDVEQNPYAGLSKPEIANVQIDLRSGCYFQVFGGGNAATVTESTTISLNNSTTSLRDANGKELDYQFERVFGGNNKEPMAIRPTWNLEMASVNNLYSGGNAGSMTYFSKTSTGANTLAGDAGILIHVDSKDMTINNVYGGCRMADVDPNGHKGAPMTINPETFEGVTFQPNYAARVLITGGNINNVYGGNDVSGNVYYGSQVEILSSINGDVYGAGNGSYAYTDKAEWVAHHPEDADYYYDPTAGATSVEALNNWRPNAEKTWVHVAGKGVAEPTVIGGSLYCGGNSATLRTNSGSLADAKAHLQIGSDVIADQVFQGSNGVNMISKTMLQKYADPEFSTLDLTVAATFDKYMEGVEVAIHPEVAFDTDYEAHSAKFGSLYCGGNVGSMSADGLFTINFLNSLLIYDKLVAGSNSANVAKTEYNAFHMGGLIGTPDATSGNKVQLNISGLKLEPHVLNGSVATGFNLYEFKYTDTSNTMLAGANIYGGCYNSGYINGGVSIDISENTLGDMAFSRVHYNDIQNDVLASTLSVYGGGYGPETEIWGHTTINISENGQIMKAYGGGEQGVVGKLKRDADGNYRTENVQEWYSETTNQDLHGYTTPVTEFKSRDHSVAMFEEKYNATVTLNANLLDGGDFNVAKLYGGGFQGMVSGNTIVKLNSGRVYDAFGGASNADILGHTEMYVGKDGAPQVAHNVYGANDFGGLIVGHETYHVDNNKDGDSEDTMEKIVAQTYVEYIAGKIGDGSVDGEGNLLGGNIFGGPCGAYEYEDDRYYNWDNTDPDHPVKGSHKAICRPQLLEDLLTGEMLKPLSGAGYAANSFVNVTSQSTLVSDYIEGSIFGAGQGLKGRIKSADERGSYVRLMSATKSQRPDKELSNRVYGAGYCSNTNRSLVDAYTGYYNTIFGAAHGISYEDVLELIDDQGFYETNYMGYRSAVRLHEMENSLMDIYGGGANASAEETGVVLNGGQAHNVYGASYAQGITYAASVEIPEDSKSRVHAIFGGAEGGSDEFPCDVYNTFVTWKSADARVQDAIYGGNNAFRMTRNAYIAINAPVKNFEDKLTNVFGGGFGPETVTLYTSVGLQNGAEVANVYGGGNDGQVLDTPSFRYYLDDGLKSLDENNPSGKTKADYNPESLKRYPEELLGTGYGYQKYLNDSEVIGFHNWIVQHCWDGETWDNHDPKQPLGSYTANAHGHAHPVYFLSTQMEDMKNTNVYITKGALVAENAYGGGLGAKALVSGETAVHLWGGTVRGDIYGGGKGGNVEEYPYLIYPTDAASRHELTMSSTHVELQGGIARNVYGGGLNGRVTGTTNVVLGTKDEHEFDFYGTTISGQFEHQIVYGDPIVERSLYGGGQMGPVYGTAYLTLNQGHIGYKYDATAEVDGKSTKACYVENLDLNDEGDNFLDQNGNVFGAGYGEGASVDVTYVNTYGGTIRNSLYGGGEIAAVGRGEMKVDEGAVKELKQISVAGRTHIYMYNGLVQNDVFGGGRGYSYDTDNGQEIVGKLLYTDGFVFGTTDVHIRGGVVGTPTTVADGHGNVFGGGNIGYCFTDAQKDGKKGADDGQGGTFTGRYYTHEWECTSCHYHDFMNNKPTVCGKCGKSPNATDAEFRTDFTQQNIGQQILSEDCRVVISPYAQVIAEGGITIKGNGSTLPDGSVLKDSTFVKGDYVPTDYLNLLKDHNSDREQWDKLSSDGVIVRNALFAGGNVSSGSDKVYANAITVYGNATASVNDVFFRDFITLGTEHTGGIYGDGNLTFVDGYRELNITNYGTDYYGQDDQISKAQYDAMNDRERAYFELKYKCLADNSGKTVGNVITQDEYDDLADEFKTDQYWKVEGYCNIAAGRLLNTIQRADFCGIFGSRMVLQGAQDRVPEVVDYTQYTINRVGELSLNKKVFEGPDASTLDASKRIHGNYFGMYNIVNYLGALTSDVAFDDVRTYDPMKSGSNTPDSPGQTYYQWKSAHLNKSNRNNGTSHNMVALASGVYLELVREPATTLPTAEKDYGLITGIVQLDLIDVMPGLGGGYVYARNEHGARSGNSGKHENLSVYNQNAVNNSAYNYDDDHRQVMETTGNFIHNFKQIIDDCFPGGGQYMDYSHETGSPAHYWYIRGEIYVYDQYVSAFTGSSNAYSENIDLPLTITAGSNGKLSLIDIKKNLYAYRNDEGEPLGPDEQIVINGITYGLNDVITWWDYTQLNAEQKAHFVEETYVTTKDFQESQGGTLIPEGTVMLPDDYTAYCDEHASVWDIENEEMVPVTKFLHPSNKVSHDNGYVLTVSMTNPTVWDDWYSPETGPMKVNHDVYAALPEGEKNSLLSGPTYYTTEPGLYGQRQYVIDEIVTEQTVTAYNQGILQAGQQELQASVDQAYVAITSAEYDGKNVQAGVGISAAEYASLDQATKAKFARAYTCTSTFEEDAASGLYIYYGELIGVGRYQELYDNLVSKFTNDGDNEATAQRKASSQMQEHFDNAFIVTEPGLYGGQYFATGTNYRAIDTWASLPEEDRAKFNFRHDALDALYLSNYPGTGVEGPGKNNINLYDGPYWNGTDTDADPKRQIYGANQAIDYTATYTGKEALTYDGGSVAPGTTLNRIDYEALPNEQRHYSHINIPEADKTYYIVKESFINGGTSYTAGSMLTEATFNSLDTDRKAKIVQFTPTQTGGFYICREGYTIDNNGNGHAVTNVINSTSISKGNPVEAGVIISEDDYDTLINLQLKDFTIHGNSPIETTTFYVSSTSDINDLSKDRVVTVVYQYKYEEGDEEGKNVEEIVERHIINIHITFKSGVPTIGKLQDPSIVLPGQTVGLKLPNVTPGAYEILGGGWELFTNEPDAAKHQNGIPYYNNATPMYWYQDGYYVAYYAKTYLGKTYSNSVPFKVANYHDIADVWSDKANYMYVDHPNVKRNSKIYIGSELHNDVEITPAIGDTPAVIGDRSEIDMLYDLFETSLKDKTKEVWVEKQDVQNVDGVDKPLYYINEEAALAHDKTKTSVEPSAWPSTTREQETVTVFNPHARNLANLDFFLSDDVKTIKAGGWTPIGYEPSDQYPDGECFMGTLHGMGYTISGLNHSLFENLCGYVYNLGVTGSFTESGVADHVQTANVPDTGDPENGIAPTKVHGFVTNSWIYTNAENVGGTLQDPILPVVGVPNTVGRVDGIHVLNCYFPQECGYNIASLIRGNPNDHATSAPLKDFNNGKVAYDLNGFYLNKRYSDAVTTQAQYEALDSNDKAQYLYWQQDSDGTLKSTPFTGYYLSGGSMHAYRGENLGYVERLFADGDFIYKYGNIPVETNERHYNPVSRHLPIWPDDYYFFGQQLSYGYDEIERPYQPLPAHARKTISPDGGGKDARLDKTKMNNIVYRVPAYYRSADKQMIHFNPNAVIADHIADGYNVDGAMHGGLGNSVLSENRNVHSGLTAIDFSGFNDRAIMLDAGTDHQKFTAAPAALVYSSGVRNISSKQGYVDKLHSVLDDQAYFGPITDYTTLASFETHDITQNLLAYAPTATFSTGTANTQKVLLDYFHEPDYAHYYSADDYRRVDVLDASTISQVHGHLVLKENSVDLDRHYYYAVTDHFLVDKQDFNAPIEYEFNKASTADNKEYRMWYQRTPSNYADQNKGWEGISIPFSAELVSTQQKGEITHFYNSALGAQYNAGKTSGHEYWLREFINASSNGGAGTVDDPEIITATMNYPVGDPARPTVINKEVTNTFLWDYYYNADGRDLNGDIYKDEQGDIKQDDGRFYYGQKRQYDSYPLSTAGAPYIVGFPGSRYYEFDLSGTFVPQNSGTTTPARLKAQTISFVSDNGITIQVSDDELSKAGMVKPNNDGQYVFYANYLNIMTSGTSGIPDYNYYVLNAEGSAYDLMADPTPVLPFRPYFATRAVVQSSKAPQSRSIVFGMGNDTQFEPDEDTLGTTEQHGLRIYAKRHKIIVESSLEAPQQVRIATAAGQLITSFTIEPGERIATPVHKGIYITNLKKLIVH